MELECVQASLPGNGDSDPLDAQQFIRVAYEFWQLAKTLFDAGYLTYDQLTNFADFYPSGLRFEVFEDGAEVHLYYGSTG